VQRLEFCFPVFQRSSFEIFLIIHKSVVLLAVLTHWRVTFDGSSGRRCRS
jgi:hypothetical protein